MYLNEENGRQIVLKDLVRAIAQVIVAVDIDELIDAS